MRVAAKMDHLSLSDGLIRQYKRVSKAVCRLTQVQTGSAFKTRAARLGKIYTDLVKYIIATVVRLLRYLLLKTC